METLESLMDRSLVQTETTDGEPRFLLPQTVREYALEGLAAGGDRVQAHDRHVAYLHTLPIFRRWPSRPRPSRPVRGSWHGWTG